MTVALLLFTVGACLVVAGVAMLSIPASLVVAGVLLAGVGLLVNFEEPK